MIEWSHFLLGIVHKHLLGGPDAKRWPLKFLTLVRGGEVVQKPKNLGSDRKVDPCLRIFLG